MEPFAKNYLEGLLALTSALGAAARRPSPAVREGKSEEVIRVAITSTNLKGTYIKILLGNLSCHRDDGVVQEDWTRLRYPGLKTRGCEAVVARGGKRGPAEKACENGGELSPGLFLVRRLSFQVRVFSEKRTKRQRASHCSGEEGRGAGTLHHKGH